MALLLGVVLRLADPLSSPALPAEDPYTHMAIVRQDLALGNVGNATGPQALYPPGMHAFLAAVWSFSGLDLMQIFRLGPVVLGGIGIVGVALLLGRTAGPLAAAFGALGMAVVPEAIFRTTMMSPTALDLAILPFLLLALVEVMRGRLAWGAVAAVMALFLVFSHPWLFGILALTGLAFLVLAWAVPWRGVDGGPSVTGAALSLAVVGGGLALTLTTCFGACGAGFRDVLPGSMAPLLNVAPIVVLTISWAPLALLLFSAAAQSRTAAWKPAAPGPWSRLAVAGVFAAALAATTLVALRVGTPSMVDLPRMVGWPLLVLAFAAFVALPYARNPASHVGAALFAVTYPLAVFNPLQSPFWPQRTVVFFSIGVVILAGGGVAQLSAAVMAWTAQGTTRHQPIRAGRRSPWVAVGLAALALPAILAGAVYAETPDDYPGGWYRLFPPCEMNALSDVSRLVQADPNAVVVTGDWEAKLVMASLASDPSRVWFKSSLFAGDRAAGDAVAVFAHQKTHVIVVVDRYLRADNPDANTTFLQQAPFHRMAGWCGTTGIAGDRVTAYEMGGPA
ncbi:MAG: hypothetical protein ACYDBQ_12505 [Thermoplasmatota archaeon]